jgi:hypothetical protein
MSEFPPETMVATRIALGHLAGQGEHEAVFKAAFDEVATFERAVRVGAESAVEERLFYEGVVNALEEILALPGSRLDEASLIAQRALQDV